jgi:hypothetical protein
MNIPQLLTRCAVARRADISPARLDRILKAGGVKPDAIGSNGGPLFSEATVQAFIAQLTVADAWRNAWQPRSNLLDTTPKTQL